MKDKLDITDEVRVELTQVPSPPLNPERVTVQQQLDELREAKRRQDVEDRKVLYPYKLTHSDGTVSMNPGKSRISDRSRELAVEIAQAEELLKGIPKH